MKQLLIESSAFEYDHEITHGKVILTGIIQRADKENYNGRIYPRKILERELKNYQTLIDQRRALGCLDHYDQSVIELTNVSHLITKVWWSGNEVYGQIELLNTPKGKIAQELIKSDVKIGISSRSVGSLQKTGDTQYVQDDLQLVCWDLVSEASCQGAYLNISESVDANSISVITESGKEQLFNKVYRVNRILNKIICGCEDFCEIGSK